MKRYLIPAVVALALSACGQQAQNETAEAGESIAADANATTRNAIQDVDAASDAALGSAEASMDNSGARFEAGARRTGDALANSADLAADEAGNVLERAGASLKD
ncbi:MAG TPA: hypothetical protein VM900_13890 [Sphingomonas sp.]|nr:hypothetical protein [Sphingomonas sp.]